MSGVLNDVPRILQDGAARSDRSTEQLLNYRARFSKGTERSVRYKSPVKVHALQKTDAVSPWNTRVSHRPSGNYMIPHWCTPWISYKNALYLDIHQLTTAQKASKRNIASP